MNNLRNVRAAARWLRRRSEPRRAPVAPDTGLPEAFLRAAAARLNEQGFRASVQFPGCLVFEAAGRKWATGYTGLHVNDYDGYGEALRGDEALVALEHLGEITLALYVSELVRVIAAEEKRAGAPATREREARIASIAAMVALSDLLLQIIVDGERGLPPQRTVRARFIHRDELADVLGIAPGEAADLLSSLECGIPYQDDLGEERVYILSASAIHAPRRPLTHGLDDGRTDAGSGTDDLAVVVQEAITATLRQRGADLAAARLSSLDADQVWEAYFGPAVDRIEATLER